MTRKPVWRMSKPTIQDIFLKFYPRYLDKYTPSPQQSKVANCIINCKTGAYGANVSKCEDCGHLQIHYNSCRNRCCPMCQALSKEKWMDKRREDVLEAPYFHVVFTIPQELNPLVYCNQQILYDAMYHCVAATIEELTSDTKHLGAKVGYICVLHTWGSEMNYHPHIHVILLGGGLTAKNLHNSLNWNMAKSFALIKMQTNNYLPLLNLSLFSTSAIKLTVLLINPSAATKKINNKP